MKRQYDIFESHATREQILQGREDAEKRDRLLSVLRLAPMEWVSLVELVERSRVSMPEATGIVAKFTTTFQRETRNGDNARVIALHPNLGGPTEPPRPYCAINSIPLDGLTDDSAIREVVRFLTDATHRPWVTLEQVKDELSRRGRVVKRLSFTALPCSQYEVQGDKVRILPGSVGQRCRDFSRAASSVLKKLKGVM